MLPSFTLEPLIDVDPGCSAPDGGSDGRSLLPPKDDGLSFDLASVLAKKSVILRFRLAIKKNFLT